MEDIDLAIANEYDGFNLSETGEALTEQRREPRYRLYGAVNVAFYNHDKFYRGYMADLSTGGARMLLPADLPDTFPDLSIGRKIECYVLNRHGCSKCRGTIQWIRYDGSLLIWGISFIEVSSEKDDPFRKMIDEVCHLHEFVPVTGMPLY
ncbi:MAG: PilZ domain-containing protein [Chitinispirillaceae bacterium]|nr:PilZ domain-containing protein [Chitinispirillaceae bacterium]